jgi:glycogen debranching enzyme
MGRDSPFPIELRDAERVIAVEELQPAPHRPYRSALLALRELSDASASRGDGLVSPVVGSLATPENRHIEALRGYEVLFGRDSLITAGYLVDLCPKLAEATLLELAAVQGLEWNQFREEEPGRIPHEVRDPDDPIAKRITKTNGWQWPYYGSIDATPLFISLAIRVSQAKPEFLDIEVRHRQGFVRPFRDYLALAATWLSRRLAAEDLGVLASRPAFRGAMENQVWKDSWDAYSRSDGSVVAPPIASVEVQGLAFEACQSVARLVHLPGPFGDLRFGEFSELAGRLRQTVLDKFWVEDGSGGFFALGLELVEHGSTPLAVRASNMGHLLSTAILDGEDATEQRNAVVRAIMSPELLCGGGMRTLGCNEMRYRPGAYHNGTTWPWDTMRISLGLARHGALRLSRELACRMVAVCDAAGCFPEFARGDSEPGNIRFNVRTVDIMESNGRPNRIEQPAQQIQAWTVAAVLAAKSLFGWPVSRLRPDRPSPSPGLIDLEFALLGAIREGGY